MVFTAMDLKFIALCRVTSCMVETYHCIGQPQCPVIQNRRKIFYNLLLISITTVDLYQRDLICWHIFFKCRFRNVPEVWIFCGFTSRIRRYVTQAVEKLWLNLQEKSVLLTAQKMTTTFRDIMLFSLESVLSLIPWKWLQ